MAIPKDALTTLASVPPQAFARQRDALAARLREAGNTVAAGQLKARRVPTLPVWVVNRLALEHPSDVEGLIAAAAGVRAAQLGRGPAGGLAKASARHRAALDRLRDRASVMLREAGGVTADKLLRVQNTLLAASADSGTSRDLQAGHLERELTAPGFDVFGGAVAPGARRASREASVTRARPPESRPAPTAAAAAAAARADEKQRQRRTALEEREARAAQARTAFAEAERQASATRQDVRAAEQKLGGLLEQVREARRGLRERRAAARQQDLAVKRARRALPRAERGAGA